MKNLLHKIPDIIDKDDINLIPTLVNDDWDHYNKGYKCHPINSVYPWTRARRLIEANIGKSFDKTFSKFCSQVPKYQQTEFLDFFRNRRWHPSNYKVDKQGNIQPNRIENKYKGPYHWMSPDYVTERRHKVTGELWDNWKNTYNDRNDFENVIVSGYCLTFASRNDPKFIQLQAEDRKARKKAQREREQYKTQKAYSFLSQSEIELKKVRLLI